MGFSEIVFPSMNEEGFAVLYSNNPASRPNTPVHAVIGSLILNEMVRTDAQQEEKTTLVADGAYASVANKGAATEKNIQLITTALIGKLPDEVQAHFVVDTDHKKAIQCPAGNTCAHNPGLDLKSGPFRRRKLPVFLVILLLF